MIEQTPSKQSSTCWPKPNTPYRIKCKQFFLQPKNQSLIMANFSSNPVQQWYFSQTQPLSPTSSPTFTITNLATSDIICAPSPHTPWSPLLTLPPHLQSNSLFTLLPSTHSPTTHFHLLSTVSNHPRIWDARNGQAYHENTIINWGNKHYEWNQTFEIKEVDVNEQLFYQNFVRTERLCAVCLVGEADMVNLECMHVGICGKCWAEVGDKCVVCRAEGQTKKIRFC